MSKSTVKTALKSIKEELEWWSETSYEGHLVEAQRLHQRTMFDLEDDQGDGFCRGIETIRVT